MNEPAGVDWDAPTTQVVEGALRDVKELVRLEVELAKNDFGGALSAARRSALFFILSLVLAANGTTLLVVSLVLAVSGGAIGTLISSALCLLGAAGACGLGLKTWPSSIFRPTERRLKNDLDQLKEHMS